MRATNVVLITGASSGIGKSTVLELVHRGYTVYGAARRIERMDDLKEAGAGIVQLDITDDESIVTVVNQVIDEHGRIDVLINNAGYGSFGSLEDTPIEEAGKQYQVNLFGLGRLTQLVLPHMRKQGTGKIINISSVGGKVATPFGGWYQSTKFALEGLSDSLRMDVGRFGIDVVVIEPGAIDSEWLSHAMDHLKKVSSEPYRNAAEHLSRLMYKNYENASDPNVVANIIVKAIQVKKPKPRYAVGSASKMLLFLKKILPDRGMDRLFLRLTGINT